jgi:hypothetical protein
VIVVGLRAEGKRSKAVPLAVILAALFFVAGFIRPVKIAEEHSSRILWLWAWQKGRIEFINSVTKRPVTISFKMPWRFSGFSVRTDPGTEEYYTAGGYSWGKQLARERTGKLQYCSEVGITLTLGGSVLHEQGGCIRASLLWPF